MTTEPVLSLAVPRGQHGIPLDVFATVSQVIGLVYPDATIGNGDDGRGYIIHMPTDRRTKRVTKAAAKAATVEQGEYDGEVVGWKDGSLILSPPEQLMVALEPIITEVLGDAPNYVETVIAFKSNPDVRASVTVKRLEGKSPVEHRDEARARIDAALALHLAVPRYELCPVSYGCEDPHCVENVHEGGTYMHTDQLVGHTCSLCREDDGDLVDYPCLTAKALGEGR